MRGEGLHQHEEHVDGHRVGDDGAQRADGLLAHVEAAEAAYQQSQHDEQAGARRERRGQEAGSQDGGHPERARAQPGVEEGRHRVDAHRPRDRQVDEGAHPPRRRCALALGLDGHEADDEVQEQVAREGHEVPEHQRVELRVQEDVHDPAGLPHVHEDERHAHEHRRDGQELAQDDGLAEGLVVVEVVRQHHHHGGGRDAHHERELRDVEPPGDVPAHPGDVQPQGELPAVGEAADQR